MPFVLGHRRALALTLEEAYPQGLPRIAEADLKAFEFLDLSFRALCAVLFNYVPTSGHPGGSISSGRSVHGILYNLLRYDLSDPLVPGADMITYAAGHKALGLYAAWAIRNEIARVAAPSLLPADENLQLRLEDLLGFRRNPTSVTPLVKQFRARALDGHPKPNVPFVPLATGASGVGLGASVGLAIAAGDYYGAADPPAVHAIEGEGGMTPGRVSEALATASAAGLKNLVMHVEFNQSSIDSNRVCREGDQPGDYVQWTPAELLYLHDWNVIQVPDGHDLRQVFAAQAYLARMPNSQPSAIVYRTTKGWRYGIEGKASHGAGHAFCSDGYYAALKEFEAATGLAFPRLSGDKTAENVERCYWDTLLTIRRAIESHRAEASLLAGRLQAARERLRALKRAPRQGAPDVSVIYDPSRASPEKQPASLAMAPGSSTTLRGTLGKALGELNKASGGALLIGAADLLESTGIAAAAKGFPEGYFHTQKNPGSRTLSVGGICEDGLGAVMCGVSAYGRQIGVGSSYAAFIAALEHVAARLHGIAASAEEKSFGRPVRPYIMVCAHASYKTGEDGPTHADPQALQLLQGDFPPGICITLVPWDPQEIWPLVVAGLQARPAVLAIFVTRPSEKVVDRKALGLPSPEAAVNGVYALRLADAAKPRHGTLVLQESGTAYAFVEGVLPKLDKEGLNLNVYYVASAELFDRLTPARQEAVFPASHRQEAMAITGFTMPTMYRWVTSEYGRAHSLHAFSCGHYPGSGQAAAVMREAGLDGESQLRAIKAYVADRAAGRQAA